MGCEGGPAEVRPAEADALSALYALNVAVLGEEAWRLEELVTELGLVGSLVLVAWCGGEAVGFLVARGAVEEVELLQIAVHAGYRRRGIGAQLLDRLLEAVRGRAGASCLLEVRAGNEAALALYASRGFQRVGLRRRYYRNPVEDAVLLTYSPPGAA